MNFVVRAGALVGALMLSACGSTLNPTGSTESCQAGTTCTKGGSWKACCTATQCKYVASDGTEFKCDGTNCNSAAQQVVTWCQTH